MRKNRILSAAILSLLLSLSLSVQSFAAPLDNKAIVDSTKGSLSYSDKALTANEAIISQILGRTVRTDLSKGIRKQPTPVSSSRGQSSFKPEGFTATDEPRDKDNVMAVSTILGKEVREKFPDNGEFHGEDRRVHVDTENVGVDQSEIKELAEDGDTLSKDYRYVRLVGDVSGADYDTFKSYLDVVVNNYPALIKRFANEGWKINLVNGDLDKLLYDAQTDGVAGITVFNTKEIFIEAGETSYCVIHELGHYMDYKRSMVSETEEFRTLYLKEKNKLSMYGLTDQTEFFAEVFMYALLQPETTAELCPNSYEYIINIAKAF